MDSNGWLRELLKVMQKDIMEIKKDLKSLQKSKFMFDGAKEALRVVATVLITLLTIYLKGK